LTRLAEAESLAQALPGPEGAASGDPLRLARIHLWMGLASMLRSQTAEAMRYFQAVEEVARKFDQTELLAIAWAEQGRILYGQGRFAEAQARCAQADPGLEQAGHWLEWLYNLGFLGGALASQGQAAAGQAAGQRAVARAQATDSRTAILGSHNLLALIHFFSGHAPQVVEATRIALQAAAESGDRLLGYYPLALRAWAENRLGQHEAAQQFIQRAQATGQEFGGHLLMFDWFAAVAAEVALNAGRPAEALALAEQAAALAESVDSLFGQGLAHRVWAMALWQAEDGRLASRDESEKIQPSALSPQPSEAHLLTSLQAFELGGAWLEAARTHVAWGLLCRDRDRQDNPAARGHFEQAAAQFEASNLVDELAQTRRWLAEVSSET
jgi:tetratricopeptide (TPR) repeat protein